MCKRIKKSFSARVELYIMLIVSMTFLATFAVVFIYNYKNTKEQTCEYASKLLDNTNLEIEKVFNSVEQAADNVKPFIISEHLSPDTLYRVVRQTVENNENVYGCGVAFEPNYFPQKGYYFAPYAWRNGENILTKQLGNIDNDYFTSDWYQIPKLLGKNGWSEPYFDEAGKKISRTTYSSLMYNAKGEFIGTFTADVELMWLNRLVSDIKPYPHASTYLIGRSGTFIIHPNTDFILNESIFSVALHNNDTKMYEIGQKMVDGESGYDVIKSEGVYSYVFYRSIPAYGWSIAMVCPITEVFSNITKMRIWLNCIILVGMIVLLISTYFIVKKMTRPLKEFSDAAKEIAHGKLDTKLPDIKSQDEMLDMRNSFDYMQNELHNYIENLQKTTQAKEKIENELHIAHEIQMSMIPKIFPPFPQRKDIDLYATLTPAKEVGGDLYDFFLKDSKLYFAIGDVSGKGVPASLVMAITKSLMHTLAMQTQSLKQLVEALNNAIAENNSANFFVTFFIGILDLDTGHVSYCNAGHNPPLLLTPDGKVSPFKVIPNIPLGLFDGFEYTEESIDIEKDTKIILFTDGVTEAENAEKELYNDDRLQNCVANNANATIKELVKSIVTDVNDHVKDASQSDDLTILALHFIKNQEDSNL